MVVAMTAMMVVRVMAVTMVMAAMMVTIVMAACTHTAFAVVAVGAVPPAAFTALSTAAGAAGDCVLFVPVAFAAAVVLGVGSFTSKTSPPTIIFWPVEAGTVLHSTLILPHPPDDDKAPSPATFAGRGVGDSPLRDTATADEPFWPPSEDEPFMGTAYLITQQQFVSIAPRG